MVGICICRKRCSIGLIVIKPSLMENSVCNRKCANGDEELLEGALVDEFFDMQIDQYRGTKNP